MLPQGAVGLGVWTLAAGAMCAAGLAAPEGTLTWAPQARLEVFYRRLPGPEAAEGPPVVLLHPWGLDHRVWDEVAPALARARDVLLVDLPAHGRSDRSHVAWSMARLGRAVLDVMDAAGIERAFVAGNSLGGATALELARQAPERVAGLILVAAPGGRRLSARLRRLARQAVTPENLATLSEDAWRIGLRVAGRRDRPSMTRATRALLAERRDPTRWRAFARSAAAVLLEVADYAPPLEQIATPALVVHGAADRLVTEDLSRSLAAGLPAGRLHVLEGCGHMPELECPDALLSAITPFLRGVGPGSPEAARVR